MGKEEELQRKYMELQRLDNELNELKNQLQHLDKQGNEIENLTASLDEWKEVKEGQEILAPISQGIFIKAKVTGNDNLLVNVGSNVVVAKDIEQVKDMLKTQKTQIEKTSEEFLTEFQKVGMQALALENEITDHSK